MRRAVEQARFSSDQDRQNEKTQSRLKVTPRCHFIFYSPRHKQGDKLTRKSKREAAKIDKTLQFGDYVSAYPRSNSLRKSPKFKFDKVPRLEVIVILK